MSDNVSRISMVRACTLLTVLAIGLTLCPPSAESEEWQFQLAPYFWLAGQEGEVATLPGLPSAELDLDFADIFEDLDGSLMLVGEARKGRFGLFADFEYVNVESEDPTPKGRLFSKIELTTESIMMSAAGFYRLLQEDRMFLDFMAGLRYWSIDTELTLHAGALAARAVSHSEDWVDPFVGIKGLLPLGESPFFVGSHFLIGGFGAGSDLMWDYHVNLGYRWTESFSTTLGYRYLDVDYDDDGFLYDIGQHGVLIGLGWRF